MIEYDHQVIRTPRTEYRAPSVIRLQYQIRRPRPRVKLSRREVFARDRHTCQYCGRQSHDLTLDHVVPRHRGWRTHLGEPRRRMQAVQSPQGWQDARGGPPPPPSPAIRAAQRHLLAVHAVPRGRTERSVALVPVPGSQLTGPSAAIEAAIPAAVDDLLGTIWGAGHAAYVVGGSLRDVVLGRDAGRLGPRLGGTARARSSRSSRTPSTRTSSGRSPSGATARSSRSRPSGPTTTTPTSADRIGSSSAIRSKPTWRAATSRSTRWPGAAGRARRPRSSIRTAEPSMPMPASCAPSAIRRPGSRRTRCG